MALTWQQANAREALLFSECRKHGAVWVLMRDGGLANWTEDESRVVPVWANRAEAERCAVSDLAAHAAEPIELSSFMNDLLPTLAAQGFWVALHPDWETAGNQRPADVLADLLRSDGAA